MVKLDMYWASEKSWLKFEDDKILLRDNAPEEAKQSYRRYIKERDQYYKAEKETKANII